MSTAFRLTEHERRVLRILPKPLHVMVLAHHYVDELADLIQECALEVCTLNADDELDFQAIYATARSRVRRFTQENFAHRGQNFEWHEAAAAEAADDDNPHPGQLEAHTPTPLTRADIVRDVAEQQNIGIREAQIRVKEQIERTKRNGDLFLGDDGEGEE